MYSFPRPGETLFNEGNHSSTPVINELDWFSRDLADRYPWLAAQAAVFLLTGIPPVVETISGEIHLAQFRPLSRITLKIDPAISPQEVFEKYSAIRRIIVKKNQRNLSSKHLHLALFAATCAPGKGLEERKDEWNNACINEKWKYFRKTNFARDCAVAKKKSSEPRLYLSR
jgi:hypothetical protein